jgi:hypothetical protein
MVKAIETTYKGCRFRSRLEARWAVFFDKEGIRWVYEPEGYLLDDGTRYLPDFWLPDVKMFAEVKPERFTKEEITKCEQLPHPCLMLDGLPRDVHYFCVTKEYEHGAYNYELLCVCNHHDYPKEEHRFYSHGYADEPTNDDWEDKNRHDESGVYDESSFGAALGARFEFGESGTKNRHEVISYDVDEPLDDDGDWTYWD